MARFVPSSPALVRATLLAHGRRNPAAIPGLSTLPLDQQKQVQAAVKKGKSKSKKQKLADAMKKAKKYRDKYKKCQASLDAQGLKAYPEETPWTQTTTCKSDYKKWKKYERKAAKLAAELAYQSPADQKAAINAANAAASQASSEEEAAQILSSATRLDSVSASALIAPRMSARREHGEAQGRAKNRARKKGRPESEELAAVPPLEAYAEDSEEEGDYTDYIVPGLVAVGVLAALGGGVWWVRRRKS